MPGLLLIPNVQGNACGKHHNIHIIHTFKALQTCASLNTSGNYNANGKIKGRARTGVTGIKAGI